MNRPPGPSTAQPFGLWAVAGGEQLVRLGAATDVGQAGADGTDRFEPHAFLPAVQLVVVFGVVAEGDQVALDLGHDRLFDPALLVSQEHPHRALFGTELIELAMQHGPRALQAPKP